MKVITLASVPHTGTFFVENFLRNHPGVGHAVNIAPVVKNKAMIRRRLDDRAFEEGLEPSTVNLIQAHLEGFYRPFIQCFGLFGPLVIPMRDPLLSIISTVERNPATNPMQRVESFIALAKDIVSQIHVFCPFFVPVDLLAAKKASERYTHLIGLQAHCGLLVDYEYTAKVAYPWEEVNTGGKYALKQAYAERNKSLIWGILAGEIGVLQANEDLLRPMLEKIGYQGLMWWS